MSSVSITEMTEVVFASKMSEEFIFVQESQLTIFTAWVTFVTAIIRISNTTVFSYLFTCITSSLRRENFKILCANLTVEQLVNLSNMFLKLVELKKERVFAFRAAVFQQFVEGFLDFQVSKSDSIFLFI